MEGKAAHSQARVNSSLTVFGVDVAIWVVVYEIQTNIQVYNRLIDEFLGSVRRRRIQKWSPTHPPTLDLNQKIDLAYLVTP